VRVWTLEDPFAVDPVTRINKALSSEGDCAEIGRTLAEAGEVVVNLTGGSTLMQYVAERIGRWAEDKLGIPLRRIATVDRRSAAQQAADPYQPGKIHTLS
jgi:hypothetical protein